MSIICQINKRMSCSDKLNLFLIMYVFYNLLLKNYKNHSLIYYYLLNKASIPQKYFLIKLLGLYFSSRFKLMYVRINIILLSMF